MPYSEGELAKELVNVKLDITEIKSSVNYIKQQLINNDRAVQGIHQLTNTVDKLADAIEQLSQKTTAEIENIRGSIKRTGERLEALEKEPADKWKSLTAQIVSLVVTGLAGAVITAVLMTLKNGGV